MNDLEREIRDTLQQHQGDAPPLDVTDARRTAGRARRRQARNVVLSVIAGAVVIVALAAPGGLLRADRSPTVLDQPSPSPTCVGPNDTEPAHDWPGPTRNPAGVYYWAASPQPQFPDSTLGFMHNAYSPGSGEVNILFDGDPGHLIPHRGETAVTVAGCQGTYRRYDGRWQDFSVRGQVEEWMVDIQGTTVTFVIIAEPGAPIAEVAEAREIIGSIRVDPEASDLGFALIFTLATNTWDSG